jgi:hypothetical protein
MKQEAGLTCDREVGQLVIMRGLSKRQGQTVTVSLGHTEIIKKRQD